MEIEVNILIILLNLEQRIEISGLKPGDQVTGFIIIK
jgi:hypothetical protein